jgi:hypothetical protein
MIKIIGKFFATFRRKVFAAQVNREIFHKVFPHLRREANHGYPFTSDEEIVKTHVRGRLQTKLDFDLIERAAARMPKAYAEAFRYILYRDLQKRMEMYMEIAEDRIQPETCDPRLVATRA